MRRILFAALLLSSVLGCSGPGPEGAGDVEVAEAAEARAPDADTSHLVSVRHDMVRSQIANRGIRDTAVLDAMRAIPRHRFVPDASPEQAYSDTPLPIGHGQTISQPYIVAFMAEAADISSGDRVLEIGTGSGYGAAVLAEIADQVYTIEIVEELAQRAREVLRSTGYDNVDVKTGNGWLGWPEHAPYDAVVVTAAPDEVPDALAEQLAVGGTMVVPVGTTRQTLQVLRKTDEGLVEEKSLPVRFVPMVGEPPDTAR